MKGHGKIAVDTVIWVPIGSVNDVIASNFHGRPPNLLSLDILKSSETLTQFPRRLTHASHLQNRQTSKQGDSREKLDIVFQRAYDSRNRTDERISIRCGTKGAQWHNIVFKRCSGAA